jgi:acyl-CoA thioesterase I
LRPLLVLTALICAGACAAPLSTPQHSPSTPPSPGATPTVSAAATSPAAGPLRYVALGDSYTIGTGVGAADRFPDQLVEALRGTVELELVANLGVNGYSSADLIARELPQLAELEPGFVTLLIGVNDVVRGVPLDSYRANVQHILDELLASLPAARIVVVSIPDYTLTPAGSSFGDPAQQSAAIDEANSIMAAEAGQRGIAFVDIGAVARRVPDDRTLVASDGLHPSGRQYAGWVELIAPVVRGLIGGDA